MSHRSNQGWLRGQAPRWLLALNGVLAIAYVAILALWFPIGQPVLFGLLIAGELFHLWQSLGFIATIWPTPAKPRFDASLTPPVDVFITVAGEPAEVVEQTAKAALAQDYAGRHKVHLLNDGLVAGKDNWKDIERLARKLGVKCITRRRPGGAKAGNINNALRETSSDLVAVLDADHIPMPDFLSALAGYFVDERMGFVQSPQFYGNAGASPVAEAAWDQQALFFGPLCRGKGAFDATFMCGTNMVIRRQALLDAGGMCEDNIAEDFLTSLFMHSKGWKSVYVPQILAVGLAPEDLQSYCGQQFRWARGSLEVIFKYNPLWRRGLNWRQRFQYLYSASFFLSGLIIVMNAALPLIFFYTGRVPVLVSTMGLAAVFLPFILTTVIVLERSSGSAFTFRALAFSLSQWWLQLRALFAVLIGRQSSFKVTPKTAQSGFFWRLVAPHLLYAGLAIGGVGYALWREGLTASVISNSSWALIYLGAFTPFIAAAWPQRRRSTDDATAAARAARTRA